MFGGEVARPDLEVRVEPLRRPHKAAVMRGQRQPLEAELPRHVKARPERGLHRGHERPVHVHHLRPHARQQQPRRVPLPLPRHDDAVVLHLRVGGIARQLGLQGCGRLLLSARPGAGRSLVAWLYAQDYCVHIRDKT